VFVVPPPADEGDHMARPPLSARPPADPAEERTLRRLASARHAPASLIQRARIVTASWDGASVAELAQRLGCHPKTVYKWLHRFNAAQGLDGLTDLPRPGLPRRITETERGRIIALARTEPPGRLQQGGEGLLAPDQPQAPAHWTLDALAQAAQAEGIGVGRSQVRRILGAERVRWRRTRSWATSTDPDFAPKGRRSSPATPTHPRRRPWSAPTSSAR
jgi:transposase